MRIFTMAALAAAFGAAPALAADAPDLIIDNTTFEMALPSMWTGFYAGVGVTGAYGVLNGEYLGFVDLVAGGNVEAGAFVFGAEAWLSGWQTNLAGPGISGGAEVRAGYLVTPDVLVYGSLGAMKFLVNGTQAYAQVGGGVEFAVAENLSLDLEYKYWLQITGPQIHRLHSLSASLLWHF